MKRLLPLLSILALLLLPACGQEDGPREGDLVSVRGMGRFRYQGGGGQSKKGREYVTLWRYI